MSLPSLIKTRESIRKIMEFRFCRSEPIRFTRDRLREESNKFNMLQSHVHSYEFEILLLRIRMTFFERSQRKEIL